jgi:hypothetical protein
MNKEFTLSSGAVLRVTEADFLTANSLKKALMRSIKFEMDKEILERIRDVYISDEVEVWIFKCFPRCTYENLTVNVQLFDNPKYSENARKDYHEICMKVIEVNCGPFLERILSELKSIITKINDIQKSQSI